MPKGFFVSFEGIDGVGKTLQLRMLRDSLTRAGLDVLVTKEPGDMIDGQLVGSDIGPTIRHLIFRDPSSNNMAPGVADALFLADHIQVVGKVIEPALEQGKIVLCDRFADSQFAYASAPDRKAEDWSLDAYKANFNLKPDLTILLTALPDDIPGTKVKSYTWLQGRTKRTGTSEEGKQDGKTWANQESQLAIQTAYVQQLAHLDRTLNVYVGSTDSAERVHNYIWSCLLIHLVNRGLMPQQLEQTVEAVA